MRDLIFHLLVGVLVLLPVGILWLAGPIVWKALLTGQLEARNAIYHRQRQPRMYYFGTQKLVE